MSNRIVILHLVSHVVFYNCITVTVVPKCCLIYKYVYLEKAHFLSSLNSHLTFTYPQDVCVG